MSSQAYGAPYGQQQGSYGGPAQSPAPHYATQQMGYAGPGVGGYGRGQPTPTTQWSPAPAQGYNSAYGGFQG